MDKEIHARNMRKEELSQRFRAGVIPVHEESLWELEEYLISIKLSKKRINSIMWKVRNL